MFTSRKISLPKHRQDLFRAAYRAYMAETGAKINHVRCRKAASRFTDIKLAPGEVHNWLHGDVGMGATKLEHLATSIMGRRPVDIDPEWEDPYTIEESFGHDTDSYGRKIISLCLTVRTPEQEQAMAEFLAAFQDTIKRVKRHEVR